MLTPFLFHFLLSAVQEENKILPKESYTTKNTWINITFMMKMQQIVVLSQAEAELKQKLWQLCQFTASITSSARLETQPGPQTETAAL